MNTELLILFLVYLAIIIAIFLILRQVVCWYLKINISLELKEQEIANQETIINLLKKIVKEEEQHSNVSSDAIIQKQLEFNEKEQSIIQEIRLSLTANEIIIINKDTREIKKVEKGAFVPDAKKWVDII
jgi:hypothetical protein